MIRLSDSAIDVEIIDAVIWVIPPVLFVSSLSGSADVFEALGVRVTASPAVVERCLAEARIGFFFIKAGASR